MRKIKQIEVSEITSYKMVRDLPKLQDKFPDLNMSWGVELYGSPEHGNTTGIDDTQQIYTLTAIGNTKFSCGGPWLNTAIHLNYGFADMFNKGRNWKQSKIWEIISDYSPNKAVYNLFTLTDEQIQNFSTKHFYEFLHALATKNRLIDKNVNYYLEIQPKVYDLMKKIIADQKTMGDILAGNPDIKLLENIKGLFVTTEPYGRITGGHYTTYGAYKYCDIAQNIEPTSWAGGITPENVTDHLRGLSQQIAIERIDISTRRGVMTDGKTDLDKVEVLMHNANEWQKEFNQKIK